jgi:hypothetical protein
MRQSFVVASPFVLPRDWQISPVLQSLSFSQGAQRACVQSKPVSQSSRLEQRRLQSCVVVSQYSFAAHCVSWVQGTQRPSWQDRPEKQSVCFVQRPQKRARKQDCWFCAQSSSSLHWGEQTPSLQPS